MLISKFFKCQSIVAAFTILFMYSVSGHAEMAGKVEFSMGAVSAVTSSGDRRALMKGSEILSGDTIATADGRAQVRFTDGGYISLQPNTEFKVEEYNYAGKTDGSEKGFFSLIKGGMRAITGAIGHAKRDAYRVNTPVATIGIRGTEYLASFNGTLLVKVGDGAVFLSNNSGNLMLYQGQVGEVGGPNSKPQHSLQEMSLGANGPRGVRAGDVQRAADKIHQQVNTYVRGDLTNSSGSNLSVEEIATSASSLTDIQSLADLSAILSSSSVLTPLADMQSLASVSATANYSLSGSGFVVSPTAGTLGTVSTMNIQVQFGTGNITLTGLQFNLSGESFNLRSQPTATIVNNVIVPSTLGTVTSGSLCAQTCSFEILGAFVGSGAAKAVVEFAETSQSIQAAQTSQTTKFIGGGLVQK